MRNLLTVVACLSLCAGAAPAFAQPAAVQATPIDPERMAAAKTTVDYVFPQGTYARLMNQTMDRLTETILDSVYGMPIKQLAAAGGADPRKLGPGSLAQVMAVYDPAYRERMQIFTKTMMADMVVIMTEFEPEVRIGLARAYATRFDTRQLGELNAFFATPTGKAYAADSNVMMASPEVMEKMQAFMPRFTQQMPAIMQKAQAATASLPPQRKYAELSDAEKDKLANLLGANRAMLDRSEAARAQQKP